MSVRYINRLVNKDTDLLAEENTGGNIVIQVRHVVTVVGIFLSELYMLFRDMYLYVA